jgi:hypothetical protein
MRLCWLLVFALVSCKQSTEDLQKYLVGTWSCEPRTQLPPDKIDDKAFVTPTKVVLQLNAGGEYVHMRMVPLSKNEPERFLEWRGTWDVAGEYLYLKSSKSWAARREEGQGWREAAGDAEDKKDIIVEAKGGKLKLAGTSSLNTAAGGCTLTRGGALLERPATK